MSATAVSTGSMLRSSGVPMEPVATTSGVFGSAPYFTTVGPVGSSSAVYHDRVRPVIQEVVREVPGREIIEQQTVIQYVPEIVETEKVVEIPQFNLQYMEEEVVQKVTHEKVVEVEQEQMYDVLCEEAVVEYQEVVKEIQKAVFQPREVVVEVPHVLHKEVLVEVPQVQIVDLIRQVPREQRQRKIVHVEKPVVQYREKIVQVPVTTLKEQVVEVPVVQQVELVRQVPGPQEVQQVEKQVEKQIYEVLEAVQEVPMVETQEQVVEVPQVETREVIKQVPKVEVQYIDKQVPKVEYNYVEKIVEVPHIIYEERIIEVPEVEVREVVRQVPKPIIKYVDKHIPKQELRYFERVVDAPLVLQVERPVEVPQVEIIETTTQVPIAVTQYVDKEVQKVSIEVREVQQEVDIVLQQEQAFEVTEVQTVDTVTQVSAPFTEYRDKPVPAIETQVRERLQQVPHLLTKEKLVEVPQVQYVDIVQEEPTYDVREVLKEVPRYTVDYRHTVEEVSQQFVGAQHHGSFLSGSMAGGNLSVIEREPPSVIGPGMPVATPVITSMGVPAQTVVTTVPAGSSMLSMSMGGGGVPMEPVATTGGYSMPGAVAVATAPGMVMSMPQVPATTVVGPPQYVTRTTVSGTVGTAPGGQAMSMFEVLDQNRDGVLTREEFAAGVGSMVTGTAPGTYGVSGAPGSQVIVTGTAPAAGAQYVVGGAAVPQEPTTTVVAPPQYVTPGTAPGMSSSAGQYILSGAPGTQVVIGGTVPGSYTVQEPGMGAMPVATASGVPVATASGIRYATGPMPVPTTTVMQDGQSRMVMQEPTTFGQGGQTTVVAPAQYVLTTPVATSSGMPSVMTGYPAGAASTAPGAGYSMAMQGLGGLPMQGGLLKAGSITDDVFNMVDRNNDGVISRSEFRGALKGNVISATPNTRLAISQQHQQAGLGQ